MPPVSRKGVEGSLELKARVDTKKVSCTFYILTWLPFFASIFSHLDITVDFLYAATFHEDLVIFTGKIFNGNFFVQWKLTVFHLYCYHSIFRNFLLSQSLEKKTKTSEMLINSCCNVVWGRFQNKRKYDVRNQRRNN